MKFKIHFTIKDNETLESFDDSYIVEIEGDNLDDLIDANNKEMKYRGLDSKENNCWSEEIK